MVSGLLPGSRRSHSTGQQEEVLNPSPHFIPQGEFCSQGVREGLIVGFIKSICQMARQFCETTGDKGGSTPPALLLLLSRLCLDYETSTISYILTLTDEQFLVQVGRRQPLGRRSKEEIHLCPQDPGP